VNIVERINNMGYSATILGAWTLIASLATIIMNAGAPFDGDTYAICRVVIAVVGLAATALFWSGRNYGQDGMTAILVWGVLQIPFYATADGQNYTTQLADFFAGASSSTAVNGEVTEFSQVGLNLVGIAIAVWAGSARKRLDLWRRRAASAVALATS
jgi:hypothetical protein